MISELFGLVRKKTADITAGKGSIMTISSLDSGFVPWITLAPESCWKVVCMLEGCQLTWVLSSPFVATV